MHQAYFNFAYVKAVQHVLHTIFVEYGLSVDRSKS